MDTARLPLRGLNISRGAEAQRRPDLINSDLGDRTPAGGQYALPHDLATEIARRFRAFLGIGDPEKATRPHCRDRGGGQAVELRPRVDEEQYKVAGSLQPVGRCDALRQRGKPLMIARGRVDNGGALAGLEEEFVDQRSVDHSSLSSATQGTIRGVAASILYVSILLHVNRTIGRACRGARPEKVPECQTN